MNGYYRPDPDDPGWRLRLESQHDEPFVTLAEDQVPIGLEEHVALQQRETKVSMRLTMEDCIWLRDKLDKILAEEWNYVDAP